MARRRTPKRALTFEEQITAMGDRPGWPEVLEPWMGDHVPATIAAMLGWDRKRAELQRAIVARDAKKLRDPGRDAGGNFDVSPYAARGHKVEVAPKDLRANADSQFPKRIATQRMFDRYFRAGHIDARQWKAADRLWQLWCTAGLEANVVARYSGDRGKGNNYTAPFEGKANAAMEYLAAMDAVPYRCRGCLSHVVVLDWPASDWARGRGYRGRDSESKGMARLRPGLSALADFLGY